MQDALTRPFLRNISTSQPYPTQLLWNPGAPVLSIRVHTLSIQHVHYRLGFPGSEFPSRGRAVKTRSLSRHLESCYTATRDLVLSRIPWRGEREELV
jgi:hypothetical protein